MTEHSGLAWLLSKVKYGYGDTPRPYVNTILEDQRYRLGRVEPIRQEIANHLTLLQLTLNYSMIDFYRDIISLPAYRSPTLYHLMIGADADFYHTGLAIHYLFPPPKE